MIVLILLVALRGLLCGIDTIQYKVLFRQYSLTDFSEILKTGVHEIGYRLLNKIVGLITDNYQYLLIATSLMCVCPIWYFYKKESEQPILTLSLFLTVAPFVLLFSGIRQAIAMAIGVFAWYMSRKKKPLLFICIVLIAMQFHTSAFILLFLYPLYHAKITGKWLWFVVPCMVAVYYLKDVIFAFLINLLGRKCSPCPTSLPSCGRHRRPFAGLPPNGHRARHALPPRRNCRVRNCRISPPGKCCSR